MTAQVRWSMTSLGSLLSQLFSRISTITRSSASYHLRHTSSYPHSAEPRPASRLSKQRMTAVRPFHSPPIGGAPATQATTAAEEDHPPPALVAANTTILSATANINLT